MAKDPTKIIRHIEDDDGPMKKRELPAEHREPKEGDHRDGLGNEP